MHVAPTQGMLLIETDEQNPSQHHQYSLRSRIANNITQLPAKEIIQTCNTFIEPGTRYVLKYQHLFK